MPVVKAKAANSTRVVGWAALENNAGNFNTANGAEALFSNTTGSNNTANGLNALFSNTTGSNNTANGLNALSSNTTGGTNTANGYGALTSNTTGDRNTAVGQSALTSNTTGINNTALGLFALGNTTGHDNIGVGAFAGQNLTTGDFNIDILATGVPGESNTIRIGDATQTATYIAGISGAVVPGGLTVIVDAGGHLGTVVSSQRFKDEIKPMDKASEVILALRPVTFRYKKDIDAVGTSQFGLVAEQVEKVNPDLVVRDADGKPFTVRYDAVNAMLLNEFIKEHGNVQEQGGTIAELKKQVAALTATVKEQAAQIQKVSAQLEASKPAPQVVNNP